MSTVTEERKLIGRVHNTTAVLKQLREDIIKKHALGKYIKPGDYTGAGKLASGFVGYLVDLGAIEDKTPAGSPRNEGKLLKWVYTANDGGWVDGNLVTGVLQKEKDYMKAWRDQKRAEKGETITEAVVARKPPKKDAVDIEDYINKELEKDNMLNGEYLRPQQSLIYTKILKTFQNLRALKECVNTIDI